MARLERGVRPIGFWSTCTSRSTRRAAGSGSDAQRSRALGVRGSVAGPLRSIAASSAAVELAPTSSAQDAGVTSVDLPEPDTPVTAVSTRAGMRRRGRAGCGASRLSSSQPPAPDRLRSRARGRAGCAAASLSAERNGRVCDASTVGQPGDGAAVQHLAAALAGRGTDVHQPVGAAHHVQVVLDDEHRIAGRLERSSTASSASASAGCRPAEGSSST